jgi:hypothetical protein
MKLSIRLTNVLGGCLFASGLVNCMGTTMRIEGSMVRQTILNQTPGIRQENLLKMAKLDKENVDLLKLLVVQTTIGAGLACWRESKN